MKDKEKQIEEMKDIVHNLWDKLNQDAITTNDIIDALYNAGYRKIDKDSVVNTPTIQCKTYSQNDMVIISMEEYNALLLEQKRLKEMVDRIPCGYERKEVTRKETAEKIAKTLMFYIHNRYHNALYNWLNENFGVEIKE